jgi:hypothetical protein
MAARDLDSEYADRLHRAVRRARDRFVLGTIAALAGFLLPWFKFGDDIQWWYGGWDLAIYDGPGWTTAVAVGYVALLLGGSVLLARGRASGEWVAILALVVLLGTWLAFGYLLADAVERARSVYRVIWSPSLLLMVVGQATMIWSVMTASLLWSVGNVVTDTVE